MRPATSLVLALLLAAVFLAATIQFVALAR